MNEHEQHRIAAAMHQLRPDWPAASLRSLLARRELAGRPRRDVAVALAWVACETNSHTPARVIEAGPWWKAAAVEDPGGSSPRPPRSSEACDLCGRHELSCVCEVPVADGAEGKADRPRGYSSQPSVPATSAWREARAALRPERAPTPAVRLREPERDESEEKSA